MSADDNAVDLDERSFNLESVEIVDDDVVVHNGLICEDRVGVDVNVEVDGDGDRSNADSPTLSHIDEEKKKEFDRQRDEILSRVPAEVKSRFGEIYFSTFGKFIGPVLIMNPYSVEPGPLRDQWLSMFHNCQKIGRETKMTHLTYWYGEFNDLRSAYSFQKTSQLISYEKGMELTEKKLKGIKQKEDGGKKLTGKELNCIKGFEEMGIDRTKEPRERYGYVESNFSEEYHLVLKDEKDAINEDHQKHQKSKNKATHKSKNGKSKKIKIKRTKDSTQTDKQMTTDLGKLEVVENGKTSETKKKIPKKRNKKCDNSFETSRPKKKVKSGEGDGQLLKIPGKSTTKNLKKENAIDKKDIMTASVKGEHDTKGDFEKTEEKKLSAYDEFTGLDEVSSHGETDDGSIKMDDLESDTSADEDYVEKTKAKIFEKKARKKKLKTQSRPVKSKEPPKKKHQKRKIKVENSTTREEKNGAIDLNLKKSLKKEQKKFQNCEIEFLPLLRRWEKALDDKNVTELSRIYEELLINMEHFTAPFILEYGMNDLMKRSKGYNNELRRQVLCRFKFIYNKKKDEVPKGFKATKKSEMDVSIAVKNETAIEEAEHSKQTKFLDKIQNSEEVVRTTGVSHTHQDMSMPKISLSSSKPQSNDSNRDTTSHASFEPSSQKQKKTERKLEPSLQKQNISGGKSEKKKFSLGKLMRAGSSSSQLGNTATKLLSSFESSVPSSRSSKNNQSNPTWTIQVVSDEIYLNENRTFGLEFLQQAALYIPANKTMNYEAVARNIEIAIYNWSAGKFIGQSKEEEEEQWNSYWEKIHDLAACISGKHQGGTLAKMIVDGKFATPDELVCLDDDDLWCSFEGSSLSKFRI